MESGRRAARGLKLRLLQILRNIHIITEETSRHVHNLLFSGPILIISSKSITNFPCFVRWQCCRFCAESVICIKDASSVWLARGADVTMCVSRDFKVLIFIRIPSSGKHMPAHSLSQGSVALVGVGKTNQVTQLFIYQLNSRWNTRINLTQSRPEYTHSAYAILKAYNQTTQWATEPPNTSRHIVIVIHSKFSALAAETNATRYYRTRMRFKNVLRLALSRMQIIEKRNL